MQLTSIQPAISSSGGAVTRSTASPGTASGAVPQPVTSPGRNQAPASPSNASSVSPSPVRGGSDSGGVQVSISQQGRQQNPEGAGRSEAGRADRGSPQRPENPRSESRPERAPEGTGQRERQDRGQEGADGTSPEQQVAVQELRSRDQEVRQHEQAHQTVGGQYAGAPTYTYQRGPDGQLYAVGGQVSIDTSPIPDDPQATINKMQTVRSAALAPAEPSPQDIRVAQEATRQLLQAQAELRAERRESRSDDAESGAGPTDSLQRAAGEQADARINLFRAVDGYTATGAGQPSDGQPSFRAIA